MGARLGRIGGDRELAHTAVSSLGGRYASASATCSGATSSAEASAATVRATRATRARPRPDSGRRSTARSSSSEDADVRRNGRPPSLLSRSDDADAHGLRALAGRGCQLGRARARHRDDEVEPVEEGARELVAVRREPLRRAGALRGGVSSRAARAQVHRRDELEARGKDGLAARARDRDDTVLERLAQRLQHRPVKLRQLVEEQDAPVREARLAWSRPRPAADDRRRRRRVMRRAERRLLDQRSIDREHAGDGVDPRHLERLRVPERRQDPRESSREHRLPRPRRACEEEVVPARGRDLERPPRALLAPHGREVGLSADRPGGAVPLERRRCLDLAAEVGDRLGEVPTPTASIPASAASPADSAAQSTRATRRGGRPRRRRACRRPA